MSVTKERIELNKRQVWQYMGYDGDYEPSARISSLIDDYAEHAHDLIEPAYSYVIRDIERVCGSSVIIEGSLVFESHIVAQLLRQCHKVAVFLVTIGARLEEMACLLAEDGLILQAAVLDAIGSDAAERVADFVQSRMAEAASAHGLSTSQRFSPGYCDWDVGQQKMIFRAVNGDSAGIRLTEGCVMIPRKSVSGIIGLGPSNGNVENYNPCKTCQKYDCPSRTTT